MVLYKNTILHAEHYLSHPCFNGDASNKAEDFNYDTAKIITADNNA